MSLIKTTLFLFFSLSFFSFLNAADFINIAVLDFEGKNLSPTDASVASDFLRTAAVNMRNIKVLDRNNMEIILREQEFQISGCTSKKCAVKIGKILNVELIIIGSISRLNKTLYITGNLVDVETGAIRSSKRIESESENTLVESMERLAEILLDRELLHEPEPSRYIKKAGNAIKTDSFDLAEHYLKMVILEDADNEKAKSLLLYVYYLSDKINKTDFDRKIVSYLLDIYWLYNISDDRKQQAVKDFIQITDIKIKKHHEILTANYDWAYAHFIFDCKTKTDRVNKLTAARILVLLANREASQWIIDKVTAKILNDKDRSKVSLSEIKIIGKHLGEDFLRSLSNAPSTKPFIKNYINEIISSGILKKDIAAE